LRNAPNFCASDGEIALLAPTKSTILVASKTHEKFRKEFFEKYDVRAVINFSALVYELFIDSLSPAVAIFYQPGQPKPGQRIVYGVPKPSPLSQRLGAIVLDSTEVKFLDREELLAYPVLWKVALWGTPRDAALIERLKDYPTLEQQAKLLEWKIREGYMEKQRGIKPREAMWLQDMPLVDVNKFTQYRVKTTERVQESVFHRPRTKDIYRAPLTLIARSKCEAAFVEEGAIAYRTKITGVIGKPGQEHLLKWLTAYVNSSLAKYYHFLTSTSWAVERGTIIHAEYKHMPFFLPDIDDPRIREILAHLDEIIHLKDQIEDAIFVGQYESALRIHQDEIDRLVFDIYDLDATERQLVKDTLEYGLNFFKWAKQKRRTPGGTLAVRRPTEQVLRDYAETFMDSMGSLFRYQGQTLNSMIYQDGAPLSIVGFEIIDIDQAREVSFIEDSGSLRKTLRYLDRLLNEQSAPALYMRRHVRIYDGPKFYLVRPSEGRFWSRSQARVDADSFAMELLSRAKADLEIIR